MSTRRPLVGIAANTRAMEHFYLHGVAQYYVSSVLEFSGATPVMIPALEDVGAIADLVSTLDGVCLTGGASNMQPHLYGEEEEPESGERDPGRDATAMALVRETVEQGVPLLGICRGIQEMNVALGGSLWQHLKDAPGKFDHRRWRWREEPMEVQLAPRHGIAIRRGSLLSQILDGAKEVKVNSLHGQGVKRVADRLMVEATAADGSIEAVSVRDSKAFALGVQWHAEYAPAEFPVHAAIFRAFGDACRQRRAARET
ncbi:MAG: gamma-glutamyl-gamma-aminobutyrate hydrolase family protein [Minwuia sp.]|uniref:gamma-glutamyl-gamma-aminobutyrate hydrolase family protein n=1 Tax=Minwuia sp. TaxID=2493630 RepID=UPI003A869F69